MTLADLAELVRAALTSGDLDAYRDLLDPDVQWGPAGEPEWGCHNRSEVLAWYRSAQARSMRATVDEVVAGTDSVLVGLTVWGAQGAEERGGTAPRWQVMTVRHGRITDIRGFDSRDRAVAAAHLST